MLLASACSLRAQAAETKPSVENFSEYLFGDWAGYRETLAEHGVEPSLFIITDPFGNVTGGQRTGFTDYSLAGLDVRFDTARIFGWHGGQIRVGAAVNFGTSLSSSYVGNNFPIQLADVATSHPRLTYLSYMQSLKEGKVNLLFGRLTVNSVEGEEFMGSEYFKAFTSVGFNLIPQGLFFNAPGAFGYPLTTWGARVRYAPTKKVYLQAGAYNGDPKVKEGSRHGVDFSLRGPVFAIGELGLRWNYGQQDTGLAIYQAVKGMVSAEATNKEGGVILMVAGLADGTGGRPLDRKSKLRMGGRRSEYRFDRLDAWLHWLLAGKDSREGGADQKRQQRRNEFAVHGRLTMLAADCVPKVFCVPLDYGSL